MTQHRCMMCGERERRRYHCKRCGYSTTRPDKTCCKCGHPMEVM